MEQTEKSSGEVLFESLLDKFHKAVPSRALRLCLIAATALLLLALIVGIVFGCIAIGSCRATPPTGKAQAVENTIVRPGAISEDVRIAASTPTPEPTPAPTAQIAEAETPAPLEADASEPAVIGETNYLEGKTYRKGDTDPLIAIVQTALMDLGYMDDDEPTEYFGSHTLEALTSFQRHNDIEPDGILGERTYATLISDTAKEYVMQEGDSGDDVQEAQDRLYELGYLDKSSRTGTFGEKTSAAVCAFQSANKLKVDGKVGVKTLNALYSDDVVGNFYKYGDSDDSIMQYQARLIKLGYLDSDYEAKGKMDGKTVSAIKAFQEANGLVRDGCLGPATMEQMNSKNAVKYAMRFGMSGSDVKSAQQRLHKLGYLRSSQVTGYFGDSTETAVKAFQKRNGLTQSGEINAKTLDKLNSDKAKAASSSSSGGSSSGGSSSGSSSSGGSSSGGSSSGGSSSGGSSSGSSSTSKGVEKFISIAKGKVGCKYVRGAKGPNKFDCSGFVYWCLNQAGVRQGYMTSIVWRSCSKYKRITSMSSLKRGDVLVFKGRSMDTGHVGIYLGDGKMIDASSSRGQVRITDSSILKSNYWKEHFLMAYRIWD